VHHERTGHTPGSASAELRRRLEAGLARVGVKKTDLVARTGLSRTTVQQAFQTDGPVPSAPTVTALAAALRLPTGELLELQRVAVGGNGERPGPGRPIGQWDPHALEVHPAGTAQDGSGSREQRSLPGYVSREHDRILAETVRQAGQGCSRMLVLVGESSAGKTRACWEAVQPLAEQGWRLWHPFDPTRAEAAAEDLHRVGPRTVVWLNEAHHYLGDPTAGEHVAAAVHRLLTSPQRGPALVLGTLWPDYFKQYTALPPAGGPDPHSRVRELLAGRTVTVPDAFDTRALATATTLAENGDRLLADALTRARTDGRLTQNLAGGPALLERYRTGSPAAKALLEAAMDARRLGVGLHLPQAFLTDAASDYLHDTDFNQLTDDWAEKAYAELAEQVHGKQAPLSRVTPRPQRRPPGHRTPADAPSPRPPGPLFRLADYLEQDGRTTRRHLCPPASFWHAAHTHLTGVGDLDSLARAAAGRHRLQWAHHLRLRAAEHGSTRALEDLALRREEAGDREGAEQLARQAADHGRTEALTLLAETREGDGDRESAEELARLAADHGDRTTLIILALMRDRAGDREGAEGLYRQAADRGNRNALVFLARMRERAGDGEGAERLYRQAADHGNSNALVGLAELRERAGDLEGAESIARQAADHGSTNAPVFLVELRERAGDREGAEDLARQAADQGSSSALTRLAEAREKAGDRDSAERLYRQAADYGSSSALVRLALLREKAGDRDSAERLYRQAADRGSSNALVRLAVIRERAGDQEGAEDLARQAASHADADGLVFLAAEREKAGDPESAERLAWQASDHGTSDGLVTLAEMREKEGDREGAEELAGQAAGHGITEVLIFLALTRERAGDRDGADKPARQAADHGRPERLHLPRGTFKMLWPYGLDPDGTPTPRWQ
jgi:hypothetical protein